MTFISYAQNCEDVILWRALKHIQKGFYIDVGANDPTIDSVTRAFYDFGWRGINIEPAQQWFKKLEEERPEDINLQVALGNKKGTIGFYEIDDTGLSSIHGDLVYEFAEKNGLKVNFRIVPMSTLNSICKEHQIHEIHFLKIDVEGAEYLVLQGLNLKKYRPWVILIEATKPLTQILNYSEWESKLITNGYHFAYFDGLNRFYVAEEQISLMDQLAIPPNVFDDFMTKNLNDTLINKERIQTELNTVWAEKEQIRVELENTQSDRERIQTELNTVWAEKEQIRVELENTQSDRERIQTELNTVWAETKQIRAKLENIQNERESIITESVEVRNERYRIQTELIWIQKQQDQLVSELRSIEADREQIRNQLDNVWSEKEKIRKELDSFVHRKSWRMTKPLRETAWFSKKMLRKFGFTKKTTRRLGMSIYLHLRVLPLFSSIADSVKKAHPDLWKKVRNGLSETPLAPTITKNEIKDSVSTERELSEDEQYFISLFQHEIKKRKTSVRSE